MSTLKLENIKHENSSTNNMVMNSDGSVSVSTLSGNVGVGGAPNKSFHVRDDNSFGGGSRIVAALSPSITNGQDAGLAFGTYSPDDYWKQGIFWERTGSYGVGHLHIANRGTADATTVSKADAVMSLYSSGRVTMPYQPSFMVRANTGNQSISAGAASATGFNNSNILHNVGNHHNNSNSTFTAPVDGRYHFALNIYTQTTGGTAGGYIGCMINFSNLGYVYCFAENGTDASLAFSGIFNMSANDTAFPMTYGHAGRTQTYLGQHSYFSGHLLG